jgi:anti-anti-sigma regulatory factor
LQRLKKIDGKFRIFGLSSKVKSVFEITKLSKLFEIFDTEEAALGGF